MSGITAGQKLRFREAVDEKPRANRERTESDPRKKKTYSAVGFGGSVFFFAVKSLGEKIDFSPNDVTVFFEHCHIIRGKFP